MAGILGLEKKADIKNSYVFPAYGEMAERINSFDWSETSLGPIAEWSSKLLIAVENMVQSPAPSVILWGEDGTTIYNDAYSDFAGARHPELLGSRCEEARPEAAEFIQNVRKKCLKGESLSYQALPFKVYRNNRPEDIWMDLHCSPIRNASGKPAGVLIINMETTHYIKTEQALKESEERLRRIVEGSNPPLNG